MQSEHTELQSDRTMDFVQLQGQARPSDGKDKLIDWKNVKPTWVVAVLLALIFLYLINLGSTISQELKKGNELQRQQAYILKEQLDMAPDQHKVGFQSRHLPLTFDYPTVGQPIPGKEFDFTTLAQEDLYGFQKQLAIWLKPYNNTDCKYKRIGNENDGGYVMCENLIFQSQALINMGIEDRDDFGCQFTSYRKVPNLEYDCTSSKRPKCQTNNDNNKFYRSCVGDITEHKGHSFVTLKDMIDKNGLKNKHITLKIDVQGAEMVALRHLPIEYLDYVDQIVMEYHPADQWLKSDSEIMSYGYNHAKFRGNLQVWKTISEHFYNVNWHYTNNACYNRANRGRGKDFANQHWFRSATVEFTLVNKKQLKINSPTRSFVWNHNENAANFPEQAEPCDYKEGDDPDPTK